MFGALLTMSLLLLSIVGGFVAGSTLHSWRVNGAIWAFVAISSAYIAGSASGFGIRIGLFVVVTLEIVVLYIDSNVRAKKIRSTKNQGM